MTAAGSTHFAVGFGIGSSDVEGRRHPYQPSEDMPKVDYLGNETEESRLLESPRTDVINALARGEVGNLKAARALDGAFVVATLDDTVELGGFTLAVEDGNLPSVSTK